MVENLLNIDEEDLSGASNEEVIDMLLQMQRRVLHALRNIEGQQITNINTSKVKDSDGVIGWVIRSDTAPSDARKLWFDISEITGIET